MKIVYHTKNLDKTFYSENIHQYILDQVAVNNVAFHKYNQVEKDWVVHIHPSADWQGIDGRVDNTGTLNSMIPHGVTGEGVVKCYVIDSADKGLTALQNFSAIYHEMGHMVLIILMRGIRGTFRNNDLSGNKVGATANVSTQEVHDRMMEKKLYQVKTWINAGSWIKRNWIRYSSIGIDLRDYIEKNV